MPLYDLACQSCGRQFEHFIPLTLYPTTPPCPTCGEPTIRELLPPVNRRATPDAVVVYRAPDGSFRFPGDTGGISAGKYERMGYERIEARGHAEVRRLEKRLNTHETSQMARLAEHQAARREHGETLRRSELRARMQSMSREGRDLARAVINRNNAKPVRVVRNPGLHVDVYSNDRGNRDESRDRRGKRFRD